MSRLGRALGRLLPAGRRDWAEAVWAEARAVPAGWPRLAWRAGAARLIAREAHLARGAGSLLLFAAAAGAAAWSAWPGATVGGAAPARADIIAVVLLLGGLPLLSRWLLGGPGSLTAWLLRAGCYGAILAILSARAVTELFIGTVPRGGLDLRTFHAFDGPGAKGAVAAAPSVDVLVLIVMALGLAVILALTARRTRVAPGTLVIGTGAGLVVAVALYAVIPLGLAKYATAPWLHATMTDTAPGALGQGLVALAWIVLLGAPLAAGVLAAWRCPVPDDFRRAAGTRAWQGAAAGLATAVAGALSVTAAGTGTVALLIRSAGVRDLLYHGQHLTPAAIYGRELWASQNVSGYAVTWIFFPIIGAFVGLFGASIAAGIIAEADRGQPPPAPPGEPGPELGSALEGAG